VIKTKMVMSPPEVISRLADFGVSQRSVAQVGHAARAARNDSVPNDPKTAPGQHAYIYGVRAMRDAFSAPRYAVHSKQNIESVFDITAGRKIMFQTVDLACNEHHRPQPISEIGPAKETIIECSTGYLFDDMQRDEDARRLEMSAYDRAEAWYVCTSFQDDQVDCELSRPIGVHEKKFAGFHERIFILLGDGGSSIDLKDDSPPLDIKPVIRKR
jgi:hypothetical protein